MSVQLNLHKFFRKSFELLYSPNWMRILEKELCTWFFVRTETYFLPSISEEINTVFLFLLRRAKGRIHKETKLRVWICYFLN
jgi:hypothetical protein